MFARTIFDWYFSSLRFLQSAVDFTILDLIAFQGAIYLKFNNCIQSLAFWYRANMNFLHFRPQLLTKREQVHPVVFVAQNAKGLICIFGGMFFYTQSVLFHS